MVSEPTVSVLISTYNRPRLLAEAVRSVLEQTLRDIEIIVRDDCGSEDPMQFLTDAERARVLLRRNEWNLGMALTKDRLLSEARGRFVAFLDDDDRWTPEFLERLVAPLQADEALDMSFCNHTVIDSTGRAILERTERGEQVWGRATLQAGIHEDGRMLATTRRAVPTSHAAVVRRQVLLQSGIHPRSDRAWDFWVATRGVRRTGRVWFDPERLSHYRVHDGQYSGHLAREKASDGTFSGLVWCLCTLHSDESFMAERLAIAALLAEQMAKWSLVKTRDGDALAAKRLASRAWSVRPTVRAAAALAVSTFGTGISARGAATSIRLAEIIRAKINS